MNQIQDEDHRLIANPLSYTRHIRSHLSVPNNVHADDLEQAAKRIQELSKRPIKKKKDKIKKAEGIKQFETEKRYEAFDD